MSKTRGELSFQMLLTHSALNSSGNLPALTLKASYCINIAFSHMSEWVFCVKHTSGIEMKANVSALK